jgi:hypothetical protein
MTSNIAMPLTKSNCITRRDSAGFFCEVDSTGDSIFVSGFCAHSFTGTLAGISSAGLGSGKKVSGLVNISEGIFSNCVSTNTLAQLLAASSQVKDLGVDPKLSSLLGQSVPVCSPLRDGESIDDDAVTGRRVNYANGLCPKRHEQLCKKRLRLKLSVKEYNLLREHTTVTAGGIKIVGRRLAKESKLAGGSLVATFYKGAFAAGSPEVVTHA